ncbi:serine/threonine-protein kinase ULK2-like [Convolutriloba macropyga]|uniref:serine/threonine-protein kinase ULK2-like n=1 Tax=Convolutriloba macropyga TaxID=536237 RepID=UPI003F51D670
MKSTFYDCGRESTKNKPDTKVAVKLIDLSRGDKSEVMLVMSEACLLLKMKHPNIVIMHDCVPKDDCVFLVMEFCNGKDLRELLDSVDKFPEPIIQIFLKQIAAGLEFMHAQSVIHRDLKPQNILLHYEGESGSNSDLDIDQIRLKLADFGLAKQMERNEKLEQACGTPGYMAPEVLANKSYDSKADIWSLGIILYECFTGELPFSMGAIMLMAMGIIPDDLSISVPSPVSSPLKNLLEIMLQTVPDDRASYEDVTKHQFFNAKNAKPKTTIAKLSKGSIASQFSPPKPKDSKLSTKSAAALRKRICLVKGDLTKQKVDVIVNASNSMLNGQTGTDKAVHAAAGPQLKPDCQKLTPCRIGEAKVTKGYNLAAKYIIHTVGPREQRPKQLISCYKNSFEKLLQLKEKSIAFCCISTGALGYPRAEAAVIALSTAKHFLQEFETDKIEKVVFCCFLDEDYKVYEHLINNKIFTS